MRTLTAFRDGIRRVNGAPVMLLGMFLATLAIAWPLSFALRGLIEASLGHSLAAETAARGVNYDWWQEFSSQATGLAATFVPSIAGFGAVLDNLSGLADNLPLAAPIAGVIATWLLTWSFLSGGVIDRYARGRPTRSAGFFAACGTHFWRFLRLGILALAAYSFLFGVVHGWLFTGLYESWTRDVNVERTAFFIRLACYAAFGLLLVATSVVFDYARIRIVVEDRRSAIGAVVAGARFAARHRGSVTGLYALNGLTFLAIVLLYAVLAPGAPRSGLHLWATLLGGELYILARHYAKLLFYASQTSLFQAALAHASYTAAPAVVWPDSPAAEAIASADPTVLP